MASRRLPAAEPAELVRKTRLQRTSGPEKRSWERARTALPYLILTGAVMLFFREIVLGRSFLWEDILHQYYPFTFHLLRSLKSLTLPLWNPYMFGGMPFLADIQTQVFYPLNWFLVPFYTPDQSHVFWLVELKCVIHVLIGAVSFYLLMRDNGLSFWSGLLAALSFAFGGFMVGHIIHMTIISTYAWFPLVLLFFLRTLRTRAVNEAALGAGALGIANLAGHPQMSLHIIYSLVLLFVVYLAVNWRRERGDVLKHHLPHFALLVGGGLAVAAAAYVPAWRLSGHTVRELLTFAESAEISLSPVSAITALVPKFFGSITGAGTDSVQYWGGPMVHFYWETLAYFGVGPLVLALCGVFVSRNPIRWLFVALVGAAILLALGRHTPAYRLAFGFLPGMDRFRIPARFAGIIGVAVSFLSGLGTEMLINPDARRPAPKLLFRLPMAVLAGAVAFWGLLVAGVFNRLMPGLESSGTQANAVRQTGIAVALLAATALLVWLALRRNSRSPGVARLAVPLLVLLTFVDLYAFGHSFALGRVAPERFYSRSPLITQLEARKTEGPFRVNARSGSQMLLQRNEGLIWELELLEGYTPLRLASIAFFEVPWGRRNDLLNVKYRIDVDSVHGRLGMVENYSALPRVWLADTCLVVTERESVLALLSDSAFDYRRVPILEKEPSPWPRPSTSMDAVRSVRLRGRDANRMELEAACDEPSLLVLSEVFYPEWKARVNGRPVEILRADYCLRCIALPAGSNIVVFEYNRSPVVVGMAVSVLSFLGLGAFVLFDRRRRLRRKPAASAADTGPR